MRSLVNFIVTPYNARRYDNIVKINGEDFVTSTSEDDYKVSNRFATVVEVPLNYKGKIKKGDTLVVHHNVFMFNKTTTGQRIDTASSVGKYFFISDEHFFLYRQNDTWHTNNRFCFVKPIKAVDKICEYEPLIGEMKYADEYLTSMGVKSGDKVVFTPDSEYEFRIDGEILYRIYNHQIVAVL